jgi:2-polyprenyl-3-methyl-5-hydroxy-6-metoxy-1,4-benzoquinol methylase
MDEFFDKDYFFGNKKSNYASYDEVNPQIYFRNVLQFIEGHHKGGRYIDIGCAFGFLIREVSPFFDETYGCDISSYAIERARKNVPEAGLEVVDLDNAFPYPKSHFDTVTALDVLEHTRNLEGNLEKICSAVKERGYLILSLPIEAWPRRLFGFLDKDKSHVSIPKERELVGMIENNGFKILGKRHFAPLPHVYKLSHIPAEVELFLQKVK